MTILFIALLALFFILLVGRLLGFFGNDTLSADEEAAAENCVGTCGTCAISCDEEEEQKIEPEYYADEELDAYRGISAEDYSDEQIEEFREVLLTLRANEVMGWMGSLSQRGIILPAALKTTIQARIAEGHARHSSSSTN